eukprot:6909666-Heterocapsa_arctica.AAC.1
MQTPTTQLKSSSDEATPECSYHLLFGQSPCVQLFRSSRALDFGSRERSASKHVSSSNHSSYEPNALSVMAAATGVFPHGAETSKVHINDAPADFNEYGNWRYGVSAAGLAAAPDPLHAMNYLAELDNEDVTFDELALQLPIKMTRTR